MNNQEYNGWTNHATWLVKLWMDNDGQSDHWNDRARELLQDEGDRVFALRSLTDEMDQAFDDIMPPVEGMWLDMLQSVVDDVNWREIAEHYIDDNMDVLNEVEAKP